MSEFKYFPSLPYELRSKILSYACHVPRIIQVELLTPESIIVNQGVRVAKPTFRCISSEAQHPLLMTSSETRREALMILKPFFPFAPEHNSYNILCNSTNDIIIIELEEFDLASADFRECGQAFRYTRSLDRNVKLDSVALFLTFEDDGSSRLMILPMPTQSSVAEYYERARSILEEAELGEPPLALIAHYAARDGEQLKQGCLGLLQSWLLGRYPLNCPAGYIVMSIDPAEDCEILYRAQVSNERWTYFAYSLILLLKLLPGVIRAVEA